MINRELPIVNIVDNTKEEVLNYYLNNSKVITNKKNEKGEVFTPLELVEEMLDKLPKDVWSNPLYKWLDPAAGSGAFPICIYYRLMIGLKEEIKNENLRRKHILENMLYMCEIDENNIKILKIIFCNSNNE
jgi:site-specific DNA-methyltransferase (adenine-specific)